MRFAPGLRPLVLLSVLGPLTGGCGPRPPGPNEDERGKVTHWEVVGASQTFEQCTDAPDWRAGFGDPGRLVGSFLSYRVADDGATATGLACESTAPDTCEPVDPPRVYRITENTLVSEEGPVLAPVEGIDCEQSVQTTWTLLDEGEDLAVEIATRYELSGSSTACADLDEIFVRIGTEANTFGIASCSVVLNAQAEHRGTR